MAAFGQSLLIFTNDVTHDGIKRINSEVYRNIQSGNFQKNTSNLIERNFNILQDKDTKHAANTIKDFIRRKRLKALNWPSQSPDYNPAENAFLSSTQTQTFQFFKFKHLL